MQGREHFERRLVLSALTCRVALKRPREVLLRHLCRRAEDPVFKVEEGLGYRGMDFLMLLTPLRLQPA